MNRPGVQRLIKWDLKEDQEGGISDRSDGKTKGNPPWAVEVYRFIQKNPLKFHLEQHPRQCGFGKGSGKCVLNLNLSWNENRSEYRVLNAIETT